MRPPRADAIARKYPLRELLESAAPTRVRPWERLTFEYVLLQGVNDSDADAHRVVKLLARLQMQSEPDRTESRAGDSLPDAERTACSPFSAS